ncbi:DNA primase [Streptomyces sp. JV185]|uniref:bifunctional DNA primase/polymerase n=1 Tax=Streptomyces sp. JV185 TaxID=858638 RepID=UPI002E79E20C|nr:bifunctional DNA primase/polymerase [Streptomyces sp. JV185]MEE1768450.1 DNA primase [Streptomyces sp. JV185]
MTPARKTTPPRGPASPDDRLRTALGLAAASVPVLPLRVGKIPFGNCPTCTGGACGGRPNMKVPGPCQCPRPCHGWAAATTNPDVLRSPAWVETWRRAHAVAYHPGGAHLTVVDLDTPDAVTWARQALPTTRTVLTTRGEHWIYLGTMQSANNVRTGVDIKSRMQYARWLGTGTGAMTHLPDTVRALISKEETTAARSEVVSSSTRSGTWDRAVATGCRHTKRYVDTGLARGLDSVRACTTSGAGSKAYGVAAFIAKQHAECPGPCGLDILGQHIIDTAVSVGVPEPYARRAVTRGIHGPVLLDRAS